MSRIKAQKFLTDALGIVLPYHSMGKIDSLDLLGTTELMILQMYRENQWKWRNVLDIGANIGLHSILMGKLGFDVIAYEPDPDTFQILKDNLASNGIRNVLPIEAAVHTKTGTADFVKVHNNLTGNHLAGYKDSYGPRTTIKVQTIDCHALWDGVDFAKIDCEGNEAELALTMTSEHMKQMSCVMEVRNEKNAEVIFEYFRNMVPIWAQKIEWNKVERLEDMPKMNREGSIYIGHQSPWTENS